MSNVITLNQETLKQQLASRQEELSILSEYIVDIESTVAELKQNKQWEPHEESFYATRSIMSEESYLILLEMKAANPAEWMRAWENACVGFWEGFYAALPVNVEHAKAEAEDLKVTISKLEERLRDQTK